MKMSCSEIQLMRYLTLALVVVALTGLLGMTAILAPTGAWYVPAGTLCGLTAVMLWVRTHDQRSSQQRACG